MVENRDAATRLADGRPAVENLQQYVWASGQSGYRDSDLTLHAGQVRDWYGSEDGMDLTVLGGDAELLDAASAACHEALAVQHRQLEALAAAWAGPGAEACRAFLRRHGAAAVTVATAVRAAADALAEAADELWRLVDRKASTVVEIEGRTADSRELWLAAAATVTGGAGDRPGVGDVVEHAVKPFVQTTIRNEWLPAMKATVVEVSETYRNAIAEVRAGAMPVFDVPGALGPAHPGPDVRDDPPRAEPGAGPGHVAAPVAWSAPAVPPATPAPVVPAAAVSPAVSPPAVSPAAGSPDLAAAPAPPAPPAPMAPLGAPGDLGGGMSGLGQQFSDTLRSLLGGGADGFEPPDLEPPDLEPPAVDEPELEEDESAEDSGPEDSEPEDSEPEDSEPEDSEHEDSEDDEADAEEVVGAETVAPAAPVDDCPPSPPEAAPVLPVPEPAAPVQPLPPAEPVVVEQSPCEIAQGEVPQVGEPGG
ncbi:hypothetical protein [Mycolicibacterium vaccae]|uniref:hypothetical protein n=1 Tax=Mycolicibacterium vaccae TaxID=1810 RepID=UPI003CFBCD37